MGRGAGRGMFQTGFRESLPPGKERRSPSLTLVPFHLTGPAWTGQVSGEVTGTCQPWPAGPNLSP